MWLAIGESTSREPPTSARLSSRLCERVLVGRWAVNRWHRDVVHTEIHAELGPVMDDMIHHKGTQDGDLEQRQRGEAIV